MSNQLTKFIEHQREEIKSLPLQQQAGADIVLKRLERLNIPSSAPDGQFVSLKKAAELMGVHPITMRHWVKVGRVESKQPGGTGGKIFVLV